MFAAIKNPASSEQWEQARTDTGNTTLAERRAQAVKNLQEAEYDGRRLGGKRGTWIAFSPRQVKSAIGNSGGLSSDKDSILDQAS